MKTVEDIAFDIVQKISPGGDQEFFRDFVHSTISDHDRNVINGVARVLEQQADVLTAQSQMILQQAAMLRQHAAQVSTFDFDAYVESTRK